MKYLVMFLIISAGYLYFDMIFNYHISVFLVKILKKFFSSKPFKVLYDSFSRFLIKVFSSIDFKKIFDTIFRKR